jgi:hypothetical protein
MAYLASGFCTTVDRWPRGHNWQGTVSDVTIKLTRWANWECY